eukprot:gene17792-19569_t
MPFRHLQNEERCLERFEAFDEEIWNDLQSLPVIPRCELNNKRNEQQPWADDSITTETRKNMLSKLCNRIIPALPLAAAILPTIFVMTALGFGLENDVFNLPDQRNVPYVSEIGTSEVYGGLFTTGLVLGVLLFFALIIVRYYQIKHTSVGCRFSNGASLFCGFVSGVGEIVTATVPITSNYPIHFLGAFFYFSCMLIYIGMQAYTTYRHTEHLQNKKAAKGRSRQLKIAQIEIDRGKDVNVKRLFIARLFMFIVISFCMGMFSIFLHQKMKKFNSAGLSVGPSFLWISVIGIHVFFVTFLFEFKSIELPFSKEHPAEPARFSNNNKPLTANINNNSTIILALPLAAAFLPAVFIVPSAVFGVQTNTLNLPQNKSIPYVSDIGNSLSPYDAMFITGLDLGAIFFLGLVMVRYIEIEKARYRKLEELRSKNSRAWCIYNESASHCDTESQKTSQLKSAKNYCYALNRSALFTGIVSAVGEVLTGSFSISYHYTMHFLGAFFYFVFMTVYLVIQTVITRKEMNRREIESCTMKGIFSARVFLSAIIMLGILMFGVFLNMSEFNRTGLSVAQSIEWMLVICVHIFLATFIFDFNNQEKDSQQNNSNNQETKQNSAPAANQTIERQIEAIP